MSQTSAAGRNQQMEDYTHTQTHTRTQTQTHQPSILMSRGGGEYLGVIFDNIFGVF